MVDFKEFDESVVDAPKKPKRSELVESISEGMPGSVFHSKSHGNFSKSAGKCPGKTPEFNP